MSPVPLASMTTTTALPQCVHCARMRHRHRIQALLLPQVDALFVRLAGIKIQVQKELALGAPLDSTTMTVTQPQHAKRARRDR